MESNLSGGWSALVRVSAQIGRPPSRPSQLRTGPSQPITWGVTGLSSVPSWALLICILWGANMTQRMIATLPCSHPKRQIGSPPMSWKQRTENVAMLRDHLRKLPACRISCLPKVMMSCDLVCTTSRLLATAFICILSHRPAWRQSSCLNSVSISGLVIKQTGIVFIKSNWLSFSPCRRWNIFKQIPPGGELKNWNGPLKGDLVGSPAHN